MNFKLITPTAVLLLLLSVALSAGTPFTRGAQDFEKTFTETFDVDGSGEVRLTNRYGAIRVETWERNEVKIDVRVTVSADNQEQADRTFNRIEISFSGGGNSASAITSIGTGSRKSKGIIASLMNGEWPSWSGGNSSNDFKVHYLVKMPASAGLETDAKYCDVNLPDLSGNTRLTVGYGNLVAGDLTGRGEVAVSYGSARIDQLGPNSTFRVRYCDGNEIRKAADLRYDGRYSETEIGTVGRLIVDAGYEELEVDEAREIRFDGNYNDLTVDRVERLFFDGNYSDLVVHDLLKELEVDASYGDVEIEDVSSEFERIYIRTNYIDVELDVDDDAGFDFELRTRYGDISFDPGGALGSDIRKEKSGSSSSVIGKRAGKGRGSIDVSTSYGDIDID